MPYESEYTPGDGPLHEDPEKNLRIENELLQLKLRAEFGGFCGGHANMPPEMENEFLKRVIEFEQKSRVAKKARVATILGNPRYKKAWELQDAAVKVELKRFQRLLESKGMTVAFLRERDERFQYKFITDELMQFETEDVLVPGMVKCFVYEDYHPDYEASIRERTLHIISGWFHRSPRLISVFLSNQFIQPDGQVYTRDQQERRIDAWMSAYVRFEDCCYSISRISFMSNEDHPGVQAMGHAEGRIKFLAVTPEGWKKVIEGPFKIYYSCEGGWWSTFFFYMPGFNT